MWKFAFGFTVKNVIKRPLILLLKTNKTTRYTRHTKQKQIQKIIIKPNLQNGEQYKNILWES